MSRDFRRFMAGQVASTFGSTFTMIAMPLIAVRYLGGTPAQIGVLVAAASLPLVLFGLPLAAWVDRMRRRRPCLIACELLAAAAVAVVMLALVAGQLTVWGLTAFVMVLGVLGVIVDSAYFVHLRSLVADGELVRARAVLQGAEQVGGALGRVLSGPAIVLGAFVPFLIDFVSYIVSAVCLMFIRKPEPERRAAHSGRLSRRELGAGFAVLRQEPFLCQITPFVAGQQIVNGMTLAVLAPFLLTVLGVPTSWYGLLFVLAGIAAVAGTAVTARMAGRVDARTITVFGFLGVAATALLLPLAGGALPIAAGLAALGIGLPHFFGAIANVGLTAFVTATVPEEKLGRAAASLQLIAAASLVSGSLLAGLLAQQIGVRPTLWVAATLAAATMITLRPALRAARHPANTSAHPASPPPIPAAAAART